MTKLNRLLNAEGLFIGAHRGFSACYPENTLLAVQEAIALNVDLIEIDVYLTRDGVPVVAHDCQLERCSDGTGNIHQYTLSELKRLDFGIHRGVAFEGLRLPTLEQFLDFMKPYPDILMDIDFKVYEYTLDTVKAALPLIERLGLLDRCIFNCVDCDIVDKLFERYGRRIVGAPHDYPGIRHYRPGNQGTFAHLWGICIPFSMLNQERVQMYRDAGVAIVCTPADTPEQVERAMRFSPTLPLCDDPRAYLHAAREAGLICGT